MTEAELIAASKRATGALLGRWIILTLSVLTLSLIAVKLAGKITWSWLWILAPAWISALIVGLIILAAWAFILSLPFGKKKRGSRS